MTQSERETLNQFLVQVFNEILKTEEVCLTQKNDPSLSIREIHIIEKVWEAKDSKDCNSSTAIAKALRVTPGTLTTAVSLHEKKGFIHREKDDKDKRIVHIYPTQKGEQVQAKHLEFHWEMVDGILSSLNDEEAKVFVKGLSNIAAFFEKEYLNE